MKRQKAVGDITQRLLSKKFYLKSSKENNFSEEMGENPSTNSLSHKHIIYFLWTKTTINLKEKPKFLWLLSKMITSMWALGTLTHSQQIWTFLVLFVAAPNDTIICNKNPGESYDEWR